MKLLFTALLYAVTIELSAQNYPGTNLRGQVMAFNPYYSQWVILPQALVSLYAYDALTGEWHNLGYSYTDAAGMYYFNYVPPGNYYIQVNQQKNYEVTIVYIDYRLYQFQDLPVLYF